MKTNDLFISLTADRSVMLVLLKTTMPRAATHMASMFVINVCPAIDNPNCQSLRQRYPRANPVKQAPTDFLLPADSARLPQPPP